VSSGAPDLSLNADAALGRLRISIVCYASDEVQLAETLSTLLEACRRSLQSVRLTSVDLMLVDNGPAGVETRKIDALIAFFSAAMPPAVRMVRCGTGENIGFGAGHNLTFDAVACEFHLILNPDVELAVESLCAAIKFMDGNPGCGILTPAIVGENGEPQYLCKRYPSVLNLFLRGFAPRLIQKLFRKRLAAYEMRDVIADSIVWQPPIFSGCFVLLRASVLAKLIGFDPKYFLYFEDFDLSLRAARLTKIAYVPAVRIVHHGGHAARKGMRHIFLFARSAIIFFNSYGWKWR